MHRSGRQHRAAHRDDARDQVGPAGGQAAGDQATEAVADERDLAVAPDRDRLHAALESVAGALRAARVDPDLRAVGAVAVAPQERREAEQGPVTRHEARHQHHRLGRQPPRPARAYASGLLPRRSASPRRTPACGFQRQGPSRESARRPFGPAKPGGHKKAPSGELTPSTVAVSPAILGRTAKLRAADSGRRSAAGLPAGSLDTLGACGSPMSCSRRSARASSCATRRSGTRTTSRCCW